MKSMKSHSRTVKSPRGRSPPRKLHSSRKAGSLRSPPRSTISSKTGLRGSSAGQKHGSPLRPQKRSHSPRSHTFVSPRRLPPRGSHPSPTAVERVHDYEKRGHLARAPIEQRMPPTHHPPLPVVMRARSNSPHARPPHLEASLKKKMRRVMSPPHRPPQRSSEKNHARLHPDGHTTHKSTVSSVGPIYSDDREAEYLSHHNRERATYQSSSLRERYILPSSTSHAKSLESRELIYSDHKRGRDQSGPYASDRQKYYNLTLDERFRFVSDGTRGAGEQRVMFSREELENITIDIKRNFHEYSPTVRHIVDPSEVKLVRRQAEGHRPIFDREEIKQSPRDLREDAYFERRMYASRHGSGHYAFNYKEMENYEITRHKFDDQRSPAMHADGSSTLSEKWRRLEGKKTSMNVLDRDERSHEYPERAHSSVAYAARNRRHRSADLDKDFRGGPEHRQRLDYPPESRKPLPPNPGDLRHSLAVRRKDSTVHDARHRIMEHRESDHERSPPPHSEYRQWYPSSRNATETSSGYVRVSDRSGSDVRVHKHEHSRDSSWVHERSSEHIRLKEDKLPDFSQRPDRLKYDTYMEKSGSVPRGSHYFEQEDREDLSGHYNRGVRGFRGRGFRGRLRGSPFRRSGFRRRGPFRSSISPRGRGFPLRRRMSGSFRVD